MANSGRYNALIAKAKTVYGHRLLPQDFDQLLRQKDVSSVVKEIKHSARYKDDFTGVNEITAHRGQVENILARSVFETYIRLFNFIPAQSNGFSSFFLRLKELEIIINVIIYLNMQHYDDIITYLPGYLADYASFELLELAKIRSYDDLLSLLEGSWYHRMLKNALPNLHFREGEDLHLEELSKELYTGYYGWLLDCVKKEFQGRDRMQIESSILRTLELENLLNAYRLNLYFDMSAEEITRMLLPFGKKQVMDDIVEITKGNGAAERLLEYVNRHYYKTKAFTGDIPEVLMRRDFYRYYRSLLRISDNGYVVTYALIKLMEIEQKNVTTIIEGIRYAMPSGEIERLLVI